MIIEKGFKTRKETETSEICWKNETEQRHWTGEIQTYDEESENSPSALHGKEEREMEPKSLVNRLG